MVKNGVRNKDKDRTKVTVARCGFACEACMLFIEKECSGCEMENTQRTGCLIFNCAKEKNVNTCLQCPEYIPANLW